MIDCKDRNAIEDVLARYCWAFDHGDGDAYAALYAEDGVLRGFGDPIQGRAALSALVTGTLAQSNGKWRHHLSNVVLDYVAGNDQVAARGYQLVTDWNDTPAVHMMVEATWRLARAGEGWAIQSLDLQFVSPNA